MSIQLGIIGGGVMGEALLSRLLSNKAYSPEAVLVSEPQAQRRAVLAQQYGIQVTAENQDLIAAPILLLAIKPQVFDAVVNQLESRNPSQLVLSIMAGVTLQRLQTAFPGQPIVRSMPNTPATVGAGMTAIAPGQFAQPSHIQLAQQIFAAVGEVVEVPESLLDAVTGLSGSGPGYVAVMIEALIDGGVAAGLPRAIATQLAIQTVRGTAELIHTQGIHPAQLKDQVTSPGGTTIAGIACLEQAGFRSALIEAVKAASRRSQELGQ
ncbi:pyrroline-5-carboxylate reductase [Leptolyngbya sp. NK1-12]|uniref:Pyrroline-5-carboxylate reductase n=1 Tax=Leptolyngbya sp. NK1-12 TaxID=2547451 RepID=A0AA96WFT3_9CYAN|nr:pyrroline-5-carboxylate reductase [Leptolyngbya sp. NK1-12]WNZ24439.1 pyrroline-5-carboxylate reductase [Leptolyngbya sp. NK1-12]